MREQGPTKAKMKALDPQKIQKVPRAYESLNPALDSGQKMGVREELVTASFGYKPRSCQINIEKQTFYILNNAIIFYIKYGKC
jgi:hypothetical protein